MKIYFRFARMCAGIVLLVAVLAIIGAKTYQPPVNYRSQVPVVQIVGDAQSALDGARGSSAPGIYAYRKLTLQQLFGSTNCPVVVDEVYISTRGVIVKHVRTDASGNVVEITTHEDDGVTPGWDNYATPVARSCEQLMNAIAGSGEVNKLLLSSRVDDIRQGLRGIKEALPYESASLDHDSYVVRANGYQYHFDKITHKLEGFNNAQYSVTYDERSTGAYYRYAE